MFALAPGADPPPVPGPPTVFPPLPLPPTDALYRVNVGGRDYVDPRGRRWESDNYFNDTGLGDARNVPIAGTDVQPLYQTQRRSLIVPTKRLAYAFPVPPGRYLVRLHFAELDPAAAVGSTVFDVLVEGAEVLPRLDIFAEAGVRTALVKDVETAVNDGTLDLAFRPIEGRPKIAGIEVLPLSPAPSPSGGCALAPTPTRPPLAILLAALGLLLVRRRRR